MLGKNVCIQLNNSPKNISQLVAIRQFDKKMQLNYFYLL
jgi:hypothetical protein